MSATRAMLGLAFMMGGCKSTSLGPEGGNKGPGAESQQVFELNPRLEVDLLFVVANSPGMAAKQKELARSLPLLFEELGKGENDLPDLHVGVVSSDLGAGPTPTGSCRRPGGDRGILQPGKCGLQGTDVFLTSLNNGTVNNFAGNLADVVGCMVQLGETGCEFPHPLQAGRVALYESVTPQNKGFLRREAQLMIVFLSDRDDCSAATNTDLFSDDARYPMTDPALRCSIEGHLCSGMQPPASSFNTPLATCTAADRGRLIAVNEMVESIRAIKKRPEQQILMTAIAGWPADPSMVSYSYGPGSDGRTAERELCATVNGTARPGLRLKAAVEPFASNGGAVFDVCHSDLSEPARALGAALGDRLYRVCLARPPLGGDPRAHCRAVLRQPAPTDRGFVDFPITVCREGGPRPCLQFAESASCSTSGFTAWVEGDATPGAQVQLKCAVTPEPASGAGAPGCEGGSCPSQKPLGARCEVGVTAGPNQTIYRADSPECASGLCLRPGRDFAVASPVDTEATCTRSCSTDADCAGASLRDRSNAADKRCVRGFTCAVPLEVGPLCCRKLCVCRDFLSPGAAPVPGSCNPEASPDVSVCQNRP